MINAEATDKMSKTVRLILGDQLNTNHSWFQNNDDSVTYVMMEIRSETDYALHHIQKIAGFFSAMQNFADELKSKNHNVIYFHLNDSTNLQSFDKNIEYLIEIDILVSLIHQFWLLCMMDQTNPQEPIYEFAFHLMYQ